MTIDHKNVIHAEKKDHRGEDGVIIPIVILAVY